jgi:hypothetical protein
MSERSIRPKTIKGRFDPVAFFETAAKGRSISKHRKSEIIFSQGEDADAVFYIKKGKIKVTVVSKQGKEVALRKAGAVSDADSMHARPSPRNGCGQRSATAPWPGKRPAPPVHTQKNPARPSAHTRHTRQRIKPSLCRLGIGSEQTSETLYAALDRAGVALASTPYLNTPWVRPVADLIIAK